MINQNIELLVQLDTLETTCNRAEELDIFITRQIDNLRFEYHESYRNECN
jgi:hypothetical protein